MLLNLINFKSNWTLLSCNHSVYLSMIQRSPHHLFSTQSKTFLHFYILPNPLSNITRNNFHISWTGLNLFSFSQLLFQKILSSVLRHKFVRQPFLLYTFHILMKFLSFVLLSQNLFPNCIYKPSRSFSLIFRGKGRTFYQQKSSLDSDPSRLAWFIIKA